VVSCCPFRCERERWKAEIMNKLKLRTYIAFIKLRMNQRIYREYKVQSTPVFTGMAERRHSSIRNGNLVYHQNRGSASYVVENKVQLLYYLHA